MTALQGKEKAAAKIGMYVQNFLLTQDFTSIQNENEKPVSGILPVQFVSPSLSAS